MAKKLYKIEEGKMIEGVCGGVAEYFNVDPTLVRIAWAILAACGCGIVAYIICAIIMPTKPSNVIDAE